MTRNAVCFRKRKNYSSWNGILVSLLIPLYILPNFVVEVFHFLIFNYYTGCIKKKVIELQRAIESELLCVWTRFFHIRKDHAFRCWMISSSCQMDKKWANTNQIKNVSQNRIFSPLRVGSKTIANEPPLELKLMNFTSLNDAHIHYYY
jgi:hypothetical protein